MSFENVWPVALGKAVWTAPEAEREEWADVLAGLVDRFSAAYERQPATRPERALAWVATEDDRVPAEPECRKCGRPIPEARLKTRAVYCSRQCANGAVHVKRRLALPA